MLGNLHLHDIRFAFQSIYELVIIPGIEFLNGSGYRIIRNSCGTYIACRFIYAYLITGILNIACITDNRSDPASAVGLILIPVNLLNRVFCTGWQVIESEYFIHFYGYIKCDGIIVFSVNGFLFRRINAVTILQPDEISVLITSD